MGDLPGHRNFLALGIPAAELFQSFNGNPAAVAGWEDKPRALVVRRWNAYSRVANASVRANSSRVGRGCAGLRAKTNTYGAAAVCLAHNILF